MNSSAARPSLWSPDAHTRLIRYLHHGRNNKGSESRHQSLTLSCLEHGLVNEKKECYGDT